MSRIKNFVGDESGATTIEYGLLAALLSVSALSIIRPVGNNLFSVFWTVASSF